MAVSDGPNGFQVRESEDGVRRAERPTHAPCFVSSHDEDEPNVAPRVGLQPGRLRPKPVPTFTGRDANAQGMPEPEGPRLTG
jgi:hypothetical protein